MASRPGLKAVDLFDAVLDGRIRALWVLGTNPADSMPRADRVRAALAAGPFVVVSDCWASDTTGFADVVLPAAGWGEKDGTVTNSERRISRQRSTADLPGTLKPEACQFAARCPWAADVCREYRPLAELTSEGVSVACHRWREFAALPTRQSGGGQT